MLVTLSKPAVVCFVKTVLSATGAMPQGEKPGRTLRGLGWSRRMLTAKRSVPWSAAGAQIVACRLSLCQQFRSTAWSLSFTRSEIMLLLPLRDGAETAAAKA